MNKYTLVYRTGFRKRYHNRAVYLELARKYGDNDLALYMIQMVQARRGFMISY